MPSDRAIPSAATSGRRDFVRAAGAIAAGAALQPVIATTAAAEQAPAREYYELREYRLRKGPKEKLMSDYFQNALVPALRRAGTGPVGVFGVSIGPDAPTTYVLIPYPSLDVFGAVSTRLAGDAEYRKAGAAVLDAPATDPAYDRIESSLMVAFAGMPKLSVPPQVEAKKSRVLELRRYESHNEPASQRKIEVFNQAEIGIFARLGFHAVFYGQTLIGGRQPNLTYMLAFDDMRDHDARWGAFGSDPEFRALVAKPENSDAAIVSTISNIFLRPTAYSQL